MPGLFLLTPGIKVNLERERLVIEVPPEDESLDDARPSVQKVPLWDLEHVVLTDRVHVSMPALSALVKREISVVMTARGEKVVGLIIPPAPNNIARRAQYQRSFHSGFCLSLAVNWVEAKILNSKRVLQRLGANRSNADTREVSLALDGLARKVTDCASLETLRGYEGAASGRYFEALADFFPDDCPFEYRSRRPPHNPANAILSFTYTLIAAEMECLLYAVGLDPAIGFFHEPADRRVSLALDMMEPFRAPIADAMTLDVLNHRIIKPRDHFERKAGGVYLNKNGKKKFFVAYERRMNREFVSEHTGLRTTIRGELRNQAVALKKAVLDEEAFQPFLMN